MIDAREKEDEHASDKCGYRKEFIDKEARNAFQTGKVMTSMIKCAHGFNHYGLREAMINNDMVESMCPRCEIVETWDHVIKCQNAIELRKEFMKEIVIELVRNNRKRCALKK